MNSSFVAILMLLTGFFIPQQDLTNKVVSLLKAGNVTELSTHFTAKIDLAVQETDDVFSRAQAELILKKFFNKNKVTDVTILHQGTSKLGTQYCIGTLSTSNGDFRLSFNIKKVGEIFKVQQLRIEEKDDDF